MNNSLFTGKLVRLAAPDPEKDFQTEANWDRDTIYTRLLEVDPVTPPHPKGEREFMEHPIGGKAYPFAIRTLADDKLIGFVILMRINHHHGDAWVGIGVGEADYRSQGYGTEAMNLALGFAFQELNLHRVNLGTFEYNPRAIRAYEKIGFVHEGKMRQAMKRDGTRWAQVFMGILRAEWEIKQNG